MTALQIDALCARLGLTKTQLVIVAIDRLARELDRGGLTPETAQGELGDVAGADATLGDG